MIDGLSARDILLKFYTEDSGLFRLLWLHSCQVAEQALEIAGRLHRNVDKEFIRDAALLHDVGIIRTNAPSIYCTGQEPYIRHGVIGGDMLREAGVDERFARVCERHTGAGITAEEILRDGLPLPCRDMVPVSLEEKIICYADKFFSKSAVTEKKSVGSIRRDLAKFGQAQLKRFDEMDKLFNR